MLHLYQLHLLNHQHVLESNNCGNQHKYRNYNNNQTLIAIPIEDNGGGGTAYGHPEEGDLTQANRYNDGKLHPGLDTELMTGYAEGTSNPDPLSKITIGFLDDIGFDVDYNRSDEYVIT